MQAELPVDSSALARSRLIGDIDGPISLPLTSSRLLGLCRSAVGVRFSCAVIASIADERDYE